MARTTNINNFLNPGLQVRDYDHASRTFRANAYALHPRLRSLYLCVFNFAPEVAQRFTNEDKIELPLLVKSVDLPAYNIKTESHNQYNKTVYSQNKIEYTDVNVTFHDDAKELVIKMWYEYMTHYYLDSLYQSTDFSTRDRYTDRTQSRWGYNTGAGKFFSSIDLYTLFDGKFSEYKCMNPIVTTFKHGSHTAGDFTPLEHSMSFNYESVLYATGMVDDNNPKTFLNNLHYNTRPSPLGKVTLNVDNIQGRIERNEGRLDERIGGSEVTQTNIQEQKIPTSTNANKNILNRSLNTVNSVDSAFNEVTPMLSSDTDPAQLLGTNKYTIQGQTTNTNGNDDIRYNRNTTISSNSGRIGSNKFAGTIAGEDFNVGNGFALPSDSGTLNHPNKISNYTVTKNSNDLTFRNGLANTSNQTNKKEQLEGSIRAASRLLNNPAVPNSKKVTIQRSLDRYTQQYANTYGTNALNNFTNDQNINLTPPRDIRSENQNLGGGADGDIPFSNERVNNETTARIAQGPDESVDVF